jgi:hypothetical protein
MQNYDGSHHFSFRVFGSLCTVSGVTCSIFNDASYLCLSMMDTTTAEPSCTARVTWVDWLLPPASLPKATQPHSRLTALVIVAEADPPANVGAFQIRDLRSVLVANNSFCTRVLGTARPILLPAIFVWLGDEYEIRISPRTNCKEWPSYVAYQAHRLSRPARTPTGGLGADAGAGKLHPRLLTQRMPFPRFLSEHSDVVDCRRMHAAPDLEISARHIGPACAPRSSRKRHDDRPSAPQNQTSDQVLLLTLRRWRRNSLHFSPEGDTRKGLGLSDTDLA